MSITKKEYDREYYQKNKERCIAYAAKYREKNRALVNSNAKFRRNKMRVWINKIKEDLVCSVCGMTFKDRPECCDFHHLDPKKKDKTVGDLMINPASKKRILDEISKCDALCANCHRTLHAIEFNGGLPTKTSTETQKCMAFYHG